MAVNPIDPSISLDLKFRESPGGAIRQRRPSLPPSAAAGGPEVAEPAIPVEADAQALQSMNPAPQTAAAALNMNLKFSTDENTGKLVVSVVDPNNGQVLRQMPSEEALKVAEAIGRYQGVLVDLKV